MVSSFAPSFILLFSITGCAATHPPATAVPIQTGEYGCPLPALGTVLNKNQLAFTGTKIVDIFFGTIDYKSQPELADIISVASRDTLFDEYLICVAQKRGDVKTQEQTNHFRSKLHFMKGTPPPTPAEIDNWDKSHPFPVSEATYWRLATEGRDKVIATLTEQLKASEDARRELEKKRRFR